MLEEKKRFAHDAAVGGDGAEGFAVEVQAAGDAGVVDHSRRSGGAAEGVAEDDDVFGVNLERVVRGWCAESVEKEGDVLHPNVNEVVDLREDSVGAGVVIDLATVHDPPVWEFDDLRVVGVVDGCYDVAVSRNFLYDGGVEISGNAVPR